MKTTNLTKMFSTAAVLGALATTSAVADAHEEGIHLPGASAEVTLDYVTQYFFRGYEQSNTDTGGSFQPGASLTIPVVDNVTATIGTWGAFEFDAPAGNSNPSSWYEQDVYGSIDATMGDFSFGVGLTYYTYPSSATNGDITELNVSVGFDDSDVLGDFAFNPYVAAAFELQNNAVGAAGTENSYLEIGGAFTLPTEGTAIEDWSWSIPVAVGMSIDDYYADASGAEEFFGFASVGLAGSISMADLIGTDEYFGAWDLSVGVTVLFLNSDIGVAGGQVDNGDDTSDNMQLIGSIGLSRSW